MMRETIDINCDLGESFSVWKKGSDAEILSCISSANIACGFHAGDPRTMHWTVEQALANNVALGAHPGFPDLYGFGRRNMEVTAEEVYDMVIYQVGALQGFITALGGELHHVKAHGALHNMAAKDKALAGAVIRAVQDLSNHVELKLYATAGSEMIIEGERLGIPVINEVFADRTYEADGHLTSRFSGENPLIEDQATALAQAMRLIQYGRVQVRGGESIDLRVDSVCIHGDGVVALALAQELKRTLEREEIRIEAKD